MLDKRRWSQQLAWTNGLWLLERDKKKAYQFGVELSCILSRFSDKGPGTSEVQERLARSQDTAMIFNQLNTLNAFTFFLLSSLAKTYLRLFVTKI